MRDLRWVAVALTSIATLLFSIGVSAQSLPKQVTFVVPFAAGGSTDGLARIAGSRLSAQTGQSIIVENRPGAGGYTGAEYVARAPTDGSVLLVSALESLYSDIFTKNLAVSLTQTLVPIAGIGQSPHLLVASASLPVKSMKDFVAFIRANPGKYNAGVVTNNAVLLEALVFLKQNGLDMAPIPFNGGAAVITSMLRGEVQFYMGSVSVSKPQIEAGKLVALGIAGEERFPLVPQVPTMKEVGMPYIAGAYYCLNAPSGVSPALITQVNRILTASMDNQATRDALAGIGYVPTPVATPEALLAKMQNQYRGFKEAAVTAHIQAQ